MDDLNAFQRDILYVLNSREEPSGLAVKADLDALYERELPASRVYTNMDDLVEKGLVTKEKRNGRTNRYGLSQRGEREIAARRAWEDEYLRRAGIVD